MDASILVVDDEPEIADLVEVYLKSEGCAVHKCGTGSQALEVLREQKLDLAILDVMLPDISGFTLCGEIRREHHFPVLELPFPYTVLVSALVLVWYILTELGSIVENAGALGAPVPAWLGRMIAALGSRVDRAAGDGADTHK